MSFLPLDIDPQALKGMTDHAEAAFPNECCGFFYGSEDGQIRAVTVSTEVTNSKEGDQRRRFAISHKDYLNAERHAAREGLTLLGVYHSHPFIRRFRVNTIWPWPSPISATSSSACNPRAPPMSAAGNSTNSGTSPKRRSWPFLKLGASPDIETTTQHP